MSRAAVFLVLISCVSHASWNLLAKRAQTTPAFFWVGTAAVALASSPALWLWGSRTVHAPPIFWACLLTTGFWQAAYYFCLAVAYRRGDISLVYPLARASPVFVALLAGLVQHQWPTVPGSAGIALTVAGGFLLPRQSGDNWTQRLKDYASPASLWALGAALASSGYTVTDAVAIQALRPFVPGARGALLYECLESVSTAFWLLVPVLASNGRGEIERVWRHERREALTVGALIFLTYLLVLWAYGLSTRVAYVAGLRQLSIVLGVAGGFFFFREPVGQARLLGTAIMVGGLVLIALAR